MLNSEGVRRMRGREPCATPIRRCIVQDTDVDRRIALPLERADALAGIVFGTPVEHKRNDPRAQGSGRGSVCTPLEGCGLRHGGKVSQAPHRWHRRVVGVGRRA